MVSPPEKRQFLNFKSLGQFNYRLTAKIVSVDYRVGNFGPAWSCKLDNGWTIDVKKDSQNHFDLYGKFGANWVNQSVMITPGTTARGSARIAVTPA